MNDKQLKAFIALIVIISIKTIYEWEHARADPQLKDNIDKEFEEVVNEWTITKDI